MAEEPLPQTPAPTIEFCYRHPQVETRVHCTRCGRPICPDCMIPAPVGYQCPECVEQARRDFRAGPGRPFRGGLNATKALLVAIAIPFALEIVLGGPQAMFRPDGRELIDVGAMQPLLIANGQYWRLFSAIFLHAGLLHIAFNAYVLWLVGRMVESSFGRARMLTIFFTAGFLASVASYAFGPIGSVAVGASGAIAGVFGAFVAHNYRRRHQALAAANLRWATTMIFLNALLAVGFPGIDWRAHLGGLVAGIAGGAIADSPGSPARRRAIEIGGFAVLVVVGVALVVWRTEQIRGLAVFGQIFG